MLVPPLATAAANPVGRRSPAPCVPRGAWARSGKASGRSHPGPQAASHAGTGGSAGSPARAWDFATIHLLPPGRTGEAAARIPRPLWRPFETTPPRREIGSANDPLKRRADRVAHQVKGRPATRLAAAADKPGAPRATGSAAAPDTVQEALRSPGEPLDAATRAFFEPRFGRDLAAVRVHFDSAAARSARDVHAAAYTVGRDVVFGAGTFAPGTEAGDRLIAHELTHVVQQGFGEAPVLQRQLIFAAGYPRPYATDPAEVASFKAGSWMPSSDDFLGTVLLSGGGTPAKTLDDLFAAIGSADRHTITELGLIGHAAGGGFALSGSVNVTSPPSIGIGEDGKITGAILRSDAVSRKTMFARDRFADGATITLYGCNSGADQTFLDDLSKSFGVCVDGFSDELFWCIASDATGAVVSRGSTRIGQPARRTVGCVGFQADIRTLKAPMHSCAGVPGAAPKPAAAP
jgi:hypothetical protein